MYSKDIPINLTIWRQRVLKGTKLLRMEIFLKLTSTDTLLFASRPEYKPKPVFETDGLTASIDAFSEIASSLIFRHHKIEYTIPTKPIIDDYMKMFVLHPTIETVATEFIFTKKAIETSSRIWLREQEANKKLREINNHYADLSNGEGATLEELRNGITSFHTIH